MPPLIESAAELHLHRRAFVPCEPGFVGLRIALAGVPRLAPGRYRLRHGHLDVRDRSARVSIPPSPGLDAAVARAGTDLGIAAGAVRDGDGATGRVEVMLDAGRAGRGPLAYQTRWALAHLAGPVLHAVFGAPAVQAPPSPGADPRDGWAATVLDTRLPDGDTFRSRLRATPAPTAADLDAHVEELPLPVRARGHLEIVAAGHQPAGGWTAAAAVTAALFADATATLEAIAATAWLARPGAESPWVRAATTGTDDADLRTAAADCLFIAYDALARQGADRRLREAVARTIDEAGRRCPPRVSRP